MDNSALLRDEVLVDRATQSSARNRFESLRKEAQDLDIQTRQLADALEALARIQARYGHLLILTLNNKLGTLCISILLLKSIFRIIYYP